LRLDLGIEIISFGIKETSEPNIINEWNLEVFRPTHAVVRVKEFVMVGGM